jgi:polar amino acid transport system permease protein
MTWDWHYVMEILPKLLLGAWYTILVTLASSVITFAGGLLLAILEVVSTKVGRAFVRFLIDVFRGVPILVLLYFGFYALPEFGVTLPALAVGVLVLGTVYAAFCSEIYRGALITIPPGLRDACVALNLTPYVTWRRVLIPLMIRRAAPALANYVLSLFRQSAFLFAIGVPVLLGEAQLAANESLRFLEPYTLVGILYVVMNLPLVYILSKYQKTHAAAR